MADNQGGGSNRGTAAMDEEQRREIASKGGQNVPAEERSFSKDALSSDIRGRPDFRLGVLLCFVACSQTQATVMLAGERLRCWQSRCQNQVNRLRTRAILEVAAGQLPPDPG